MGKCIDDLCTRSIKLENIQDWMKFNRRPWYTGFLLFLIPYFWYIVKRLPSSISYINTKLFLTFSSVIFPKYDCMTSTILSRNSKTMAALTFCLVTAASQMLERLMWKKLVRAMLVTGERTCWRAWMTLTRNASTAFLLK